MSLSRRLGGWLWRLFHWVTNSFSEIALARHFLLSLFRQHQYKVVPFWELLLYTYPFVSNKSLFPDLAWTNCATSKLPKINSKKLALISGFFQDFSILLFSTKNYVTIIQVWWVVMNSFPSINEIVLICNRSSITMFLIFVPTGPVQLCFIVLTSFVNKSISIQQKGTAFSRLYEVRYFRT